MNNLHQRLGATYLGNNRAAFLVWASRAQSVELHLTSPDDRLVAMQSLDRGYFYVECDNVAPGARYMYRIDADRERPDPASRRQPVGVHGPSEVVADQSDWDVAHWHGLPLQDYVVYELHVGTFTPEGTFEAIIPRLDRLKQLGVTAIELCPIAQFPGERNWGYDGVYQYAAQESYGGVGGLRALVRACHERDMAVVLDVVYNHLGPEGNYLADFAHYFTDRYHTPWGSALNFDTPHSDEVRRFFIENALWWTRDLRIDALRLDAIHAIFDESARPFLAELAAEVHEEADRQNRRVFVIEESNKNDPRHIQSIELGGYGLDGVWADDFHHCVHTLVTGERDGYYRDFGQLEQLAKAFREGFVFTGQRSSYRGRRHGQSSVGVPAERFVICAQNHDQVGNRLGGERLSQLVSLERQKLAAGLVAFSPFVPMLFMGEEYGEPAPFLYFVSHGDHDLIESVRRGRREEFADFSWEGDIPDPQSPETFERSRLHWEIIDQHGHIQLWQYYQKLYELRRTVPALRHLSKENQQVIAWPKQRAMYVRREHSASDAAMVFYFGDASANLLLPLPRGQWQVALDSSDSVWLGPGGIHGVLESEDEVSVSRDGPSVLLLVRQE
ncbi:MAG: malto-oligosyltrehalose trehalohydrolase [Pirellulaceae bacterium]